MTGSAFAVALLVLVVTLVIGREPRVEQAETVIEPIPATHHKTPLPDSGSPIKSITEVIQFKQRTERGEIISVRADTYEPLANGMFDTEQPRIGLMLTDQRLIELRADHARLLAPDHQPRSGTFDGNVMLLLAESGDGRSELFTADPDLAAMRCFIDGQVHFDRELGSVKTDSFVHLTTPRVEATGWGLRVSYNMADNVLNKLAGMRNGMLRFRPRAEPDATAESSEDAEPADGGTPEPSRPTDAAPAQYYRATFHDRVVIRNRFASIEADELQIVFRYQGGGKNGAVLDSLGAAIDRRVGKRGRTSFVLSTRRAVPGTEARPLFPIAQTVLMQMVAATLASQDLDVPLHQGVRQRSIMAAGLDLDETMITWHGVLTVVPADQPQSVADRLAGSDDALITLHGRPVHVRTPKQQAVTAARIDYLVSSGRLRVTGAPDGPLLLESPDMGVAVRAASLEINQSEGTGSINGPASLRALDEPGPAHSLQTESPWARWDSRMPPRTVVKWADRLQLSFYKGPSREDSSDVKSQITGLRRAIFTGNVQIDSPGFAMQTDRLQIGLDKPAEDDKQNVNEILAEGRVSVQATVEDAGDSAQVQSDRLEVTLQRQDDGTVQPMQLIASSKHAPVTASSGAGHLSAGRVEVSLHRVDPEDDSGVESDNEVPAGALFTTRRKVAIDDRPAPPASIDIAAAPLFADGPVLEQQDSEPAYEPSPSARTPSGRRRKASDPSTARTKIVPRSVTASQDVTIVLSDPAARVTAARVVADVEAQRVELYGDDEQPAKAEQAEGTLIGHYMVMTQASETLRIMGPGHALFYERPRPIFAGADNEAAPHPDAILDVAWHDRMFFDHKYGLAQFTGNVVIRSELEKDTVHLSGNDFRVEFEDAAGSQHRTEKNAAGENSSTLDRLKHSKRSVRSMVVEGKMRFLAESWLDRPGGTLASSVLIQGPRMQFDGETEQIRVPGRGSMTFVDQRPGSPAAARSARATAKANPIVAFSGRGNTLFEWVGGLTLDARHNDITLRDQVRMTHLSTGKDEVLMMDCQRLLADLKATGGIKAWMGDNIPRPDVETVVAEGDVRLQHGSRSIHTDTLKYTGATEQVALTAKPGGLSQIVGGGADNFSARAILWNLRTNRFEIRDPGAVRFAP